MTTIEKLNVMAMATVLTYHKDDLLQAASELSALQRGNAELKHELEQSNDALSSARIQLGKDELPFVCDSIKKIQNERDSLQKENAELKKWKEEDPRMLREQIRVADVAFNALQERCNSLRTQNRELSLEAENMALSLESAGYGRHQGGKMCTPLERYRDTHPKALALQPEK